MITDPTFRALLAAVTDDPLDGVTWLVLADRLEEVGEPGKARRCRQLVRCRELAATLAAPGAGPGDMYAARDRLRDASGVDACRLWAGLCVRHAPLPDGRRVWHLLTDDRSRRAVEAVERHWCDLADAGEVKTAKAAAAAAYAADAADATAAADDANRAKVRRWVVAVADALPAWLEEIPPCC